MDGNSQRTSTALLERTSNDVVQLLKRFENIIALSPVRNSNHNRSSTTAVEAYQMEVETAALVRAAEDLLSLTRALKEAWLFGRLNTIGQRGEGDGEGQQGQDGSDGGMDARAAEQILERLLMAKEGLL
ncbi:MAG: hypothetical protein M1816_001931 [Peltula sp. TS41687]|nr:MAG: hypothetical protein M1816_001931 [Peltula sp. TS41687]